MTMPSSSSHFTPEPLAPAIEAEIVDDMMSMGIDPALIYAFQHTGLLVTNDTIDQFTDAQLIGWQSAVDRYRAVA